ncbi:hypothetical protein [Nonomuraea dietziae]|uniref:hypothetical protein n=1 Tax=Nonomuraea dietziae TaxID=65515 RepID=UPI0033C36DFE
MTTTPTVSVKAEQAQFRSERSATNHPPDASQRGRGDADKRRAHQERIREPTGVLCSQLTTARFIGRFLADPLEGVPTEVIDFLTGQLGVAIPPV